MNNRQAREIRRNVRKVEGKLFDAIRAQLNAYPFLLRVRFAWRILWGRF